MDMKMGEYTFVVSVPFKSISNEIAFKNDLQRRMNRGFEKEIEDGVLIVDIGWEPFFLFEIEPYKYQVVFPDSHGVFPWVSTCEEEYKKQISFDGPKTMLLVTEDVGKVEELKRSVDWNLFNCFYSMKGFSFAPFQFIPQKGIEIGKEEETLGGNLAYYCPPHFYLNDLSFVEIGQLNVVYFLCYIKERYNFHRLKVVCKDYLPSFDLPWYDKDKGEYEKLVASFADWREEKDWESVKKYTYMDWDELPQYKRDELDKSILVMSGYVFTCYDVDGYFYVVCHSFDTPTSYIVFRVQVAKQGRRLRNYQLDAIASNLQKKSNLLFDYFRPHEYAQSIYWELLFRAERNKNFILEPFFSKGTKKGSSYAKYVIKRTVGDYEGVEKSIWVEILKQMDADCVEQKEFKEKMAKERTFKDLLKSFGNEISFAFTDEKLSKLVCDEDIEETTKRGWPGRFKAVGGFKRGKNRHRLELPADEGYWCCLYTFYKDEYIELTHFDTLEEAKSFYEGITTLWTRKAIAEVREGEISYVVVEV